MINGIFSLNPHSLVSYLNDDLKCVQFNFQMDQAEHRARIGSTGNL